jgi:hypothetical protein
MLAGASIPQRHFQDAVAIKGDPLTGLRSTRALPDSTVINQSERLYPSVKISAGAKLAENHKDHERDKSEKQSKEKQSN